MDIIKQLNAGIITNSAEETQTLSYELANVLPKNTVIALHGDLGSGKTTFTQGLGKAWEIKKNITSPTFNILNLYKGTRTLIHLDAYRLESSADAENLLIEDFLIDPWCMVIEWPEKIAGYIDEKTWHIYLDIVSEKKHKILLKNSI
jgi:tRNA threonylcarbamoyladenosine biosynthesis protein TsaE